MAQTESPTRPLEAVADGGAGVPAGAVTGARSEGLDSLGTGTDLITPAGTVQLVASLLLVLGLIVALGWLSRRMHRFTPSASSRRLRLLEALPVGARERIVLIEASGRQLLIGLAPGRVQTLHVFDSPPSAAPAAGADPAPDGKDQAPGAAQAAAAATAPAATGDGRTAAGFAALMSRMSR